MKYYKNAGGSYRTQVLLVEGIKWTEISKAEYDKAVTFPKMSDNNLVHNYFNGAEQGIRTAKILYLESLTDTQIQQRKEFLAYMKAGTTSDINRAIAFYDSKLNGDTDNVAINKATSQVIPQDNFDAIAGRAAFLKWLVVEFPKLRTYVEYVNSLNYSTFVLEDEAE